MDASTGTEIFTVSNILSVIALFGAFVFGALMKTLMRRAFKSTDDRIKLLEENVASCKETLEDLRKTVVEINHALEVAKNLDGFRLELMEKFLLRVDFVRELSLITNQIEAIHPKIEQLETKIENLRNKVSDLEKGKP